MYLVCEKAVFPVFFNGKTEKTGKTAFSGEVGVPSAFLRRSSSEKAVFPVFQVFSVFFSGKTEKTGKTAFSQTRYIHPNFS